MIDETARAALAPTGPCRMAVAVGQTVSAVWCRRDRNGTIEGVTVDLGRALGAALGIDVEFVALESSAHIVRTADDGIWDLTFVPADAERKALLAFGPNYFLGTSTYAVRRDDLARDVAEVDRPGCRIAGVEGTATLRSARRVIRHAEAIGVANLDDALALIDGGGADAIALGRESLEGLAASRPGLRVVNGHFHEAGTAAAVPLGCEAALEPVAHFIEGAKEEGLIARILERHGLSAASVAPKGSYP